MEMASFDPSILTAPLKSRTFQELALLRRFSTGHPQLVHDEAPPARRRAQ
jgi:hypothetical protein